MIVKRNREQEHCPLETELYTQNVGWDSQVIHMEAFPEAAAYAVAGVRPRARKALGNLNRLIEDLKMANNQVFGAMIEGRTAKAASLACEQCTGIVVDQSTGRMYCGQKVPQQVLDNNRAIRNN